MAGSDLRSDRRVPVELVHWPAQAERRGSLAARGLPRLLLVAEGTSPPRIDRDEDWIRLPADERDVAMRLRRLAVLDERRRRRPQLRDGRVLVCGDRRVVVPTGEALLLRPLVDRFGELVLWGHLAGAVAGDAEEGDAPDRVTARTLHARVARLRTRIEPTGLALHTIRGRGALLDHACPAEEDGAEGDPWRTW